MDIKKILVVSAVLAVVLVFVAGMPLWEQEGSPEEAIKLAEKEENISDQQMAMPNQSLDQDANMMQNQLVAEEAETVEDTG